MSVEMRPTAEEIKALLGLEPPEDPRPVRSPAPTTVTAPMARRSTFSSRPRPR
jgi:hypothetical protein